MENEKQVLEELIMIKKYLQILAMDRIDGIRSTIEKEYLKTPNQREMYKWFDGEHNLEAISKLAKVSNEAVRLFASNLEKKGLINIVKKGKQRFPQRIV